MPLVGKIAGAALEKALFNDKVNVDTMDTDEIIALIEEKGMLTLDAEAFR